MGTADRRKHTDIIDDVLINAPKYHFFQLLRILEETSHFNGSIGNGLDSSVHMRPAQEISFPAADVRRCLLGKNDKLDLQLNFMGLYGVDAPVPTYFTEFIARDDDSSEVMRTFLDIFCHRLYSQFYLAWKKYRPHVQLESENNAYLDYVMALSGQVTTHDDTTELGFSGTIGARVRSATALSGILEEYMGNVPASVREFVPRWVTVENESSLGKEGEQGLFIGDNIFLGDKVLDISGKIDICIGPLTVSEAQELLPGKPDARKLNELIKRFIDPTIDYDLVLDVKPGSGIGMRLGEDEMMLGWSVYIGYLMMGDNKIRIPGESMAINMQENKSGNQISEKLALVA